MRFAAAAQGLRAHESWMFTFFINTNKLAEFPCLH